MKTMKRIAALVMALALVFALAACGSGREEQQGGAANDGIMAKFSGELEQGAVVKVLENDTAVELGYVEALINAFNEAYADQGISAERMNTDQYSDLASDGPYGYGPDVWYQANDIIMQYAENRPSCPCPSTTSAMPTRSPRAPGTHMPSTWTAPPTTAACPSTSRPACSTT